MTHPSGQGDEDRAREVLGWEKAVAASRFESAKRAFVEAWNGDGAGFVNILPPIEFSDAELDHLVSATITAADALESSFTRETPSTDEGLREALEQEARFLCARLSELDFSQGMDDFANMHSAHVDPSHSRLEGILEDLAALKESGK